MVASAKMSDRLLTMYGGFTLSTLFCGLAGDYEWLLVSRTLAGAFGGTAGVALMALFFFCALFCAAESAARATTITGWSGSSLGGSPPPTATIAWGLMSPLKMRKGSAGIPVGVRSGAPLPVPLVTRYRALAK